MSDRRAASFAIFFVLLGLAVCGESAEAPPVERADSAGIELVTSPAADRLLPWSYAERFALGGEDEGPESFYRLSPQLVGADSAGRIDVLSGMARQVVSFDPAGELRWAVGGEGGGPGELRRPGSLSVTSGGVVSVYDYGKGTLVRWDADGTLLPEVQFPHRPMLGGQFFALTDAGYVVSTGGRIDDERVNRLIAVTGEDTVLLAVAPQPDRGMVMFESCGGGVNFPPLFTPNVVWDHRAGLTAVAPADDYRIDLWRDGRVVRSVRRAVPLTGATRELAIAEAGEGLTINFGRGPCTVPPDEYADARSWAATVPAIRRLALASDGGLWVERWVPGADPMPIDVFDADGAYLGTLPDSTVFPVLLLPGGRAGVIEVNDLDVARLVVADVVEGGGEESGGEQW